jgi:hypothetical protein
VFSDGDGPPPSPCALPAHTDSSMGGSFLGRSVGGLFQFECRLLLRVSDAG